MSLEGHGCVYVSERAGVHDTRWMAALTLIGMNPRHVPRDRYASDDAFFHAIELASEGDVPVIAGPLKIAEMLKPLEGNVVFLSWGFDLQEAGLDTELSSFHGVIVDSQANEQIAQGFGARRTVRIPWGIDLTEITSDKRVADLMKYGISATEAVVLSLRAHEELYRVADVIEAFARTPIDARLILGNTGSLTPKLRQLADSLDVDAIFLPPVDESEVPALLRRASAYVTASRVDGTSVTLLQAMACEVPVVAAANTGNVEWIEDGVTGFLFPIADVDALGSVLNRALNEGPTVTQSALDLVTKRANWQQNITQLYSLLTRP